MAPGSSSLALVLLLLAGLASVVAAGGGGDDIVVDDPDTLVLDKDNFDTFVNAEGLMLVEFYAPWCGHCKRLAPEYARAATQLRKNDPPVRLAKVDATKNNELAGRFGVNGYPTLKVFRNGKEFPYRGPREADGIISYMLKQVGPAAKVVSTQAELDKFIKNTDGPDTYWIAGLFKSGTPSPLQLSFVLTANKLRDDHTFLKITSDELRAAYGVDNEAVIVFKQFDDRQTVYDGDTKPSNLEKFVLRNTLPLIGVYDAKSRPRYEKRGLPVGKLYVDVALTDKNEKQTRYFINRLKVLAEELRDDIVFALANVKDQADELKEINREGKTNVFLIEHQFKKFVMDDKFSAESVRQFVEAYRQGKVASYVKSEVPPADNTGPVKVVTGRTFDQIVNDPEKDVLIEFYAPWCGHCKSLAPTYEKLGKAFAGVDSVVIAKIDATANDYPNSFQVSGYPTIFMMPAKKDAKPIKYDGERELEPLKKFVEKNAVKPTKKNKKSKKKKKEKKTTSS